jgi:hypothetical protein
MQTRWIDRSGLALVAFAMALGSGCSSSVIGSDGGGGHAGNGAAGAGGGGGHAAGNGTAGTVGSGTGGTSVGGPGGAGGQGDSGTDAGVLACAMSVAQACARDSGPGGCDLTWSAVLADRSLCTANTIQSRNLVSVCGGYHVLSIFSIDGGTDFYYDGTTGALVAILGVGINSEPPCVGGPTAGFAPPSSCTTQTAPPQCTADAGGADGAKG